MAGHNKWSKIKHIKYTKLATQSYILSNQLNNDDINLLFSLRSRMTKLKRNFSTQYKNNLSCSLGCKDEESQSHLLDCSVILNNMEDKTIMTEIEYSDLFKGVDEQICITKIFSEIFKIRENLLPET